jgi:hypothetical protein
MASSAMRRLMHALGHSARSLASRRVLVMGLRRQAGETSKSRCRHLLDAGQGAGKSLSQLKFSMAYWQGGILTARFTPEIMVIILGHRGVLMGLRPSFAVHSHKTVVRFHIKTRLTNERGLCRIDHR